MNKSDLPPDAGAHDQPLSLILVGCSVCETFSTAEAAMAGHCCQEPRREDCPRMTSSKPMKTPRCCDRPTECRIMLVASETTLAYYPSITDHNGHELNPDRNVTRQSYRCLTCGAEWVEKTTG
jgi:hypothetical protein